MSIDSFFLAVVFVLVVIIASCVRIVPQASACVIERLGGYHTTWIGGGGLHFKAPFLDRIAKKVKFKGAGGRFPATASNYKG